MNARMILDLENEYLSHDFFFYFFLDKSRYKKTEKKRILFIY